MLLLRPLRPINHLFSLHACSRDGFRVQPPTTPMTSASRKNYWNLCVNSAERKTYWLMHISSQWKRFYKVILWPFKIWFLYEILSSNLFSRHISKKIPEIFKCSDMTKIYIPQEFNLIWKTFPNTSVSCRLPRAESLCASNSVLWVLYS